jgi:hypothetical protein
MTAVTTAASRFAPTLVTTLAILTNGPTREDLVRLAQDLDDMSEDVLAAAETSGEDIPETLVDSLGKAIGLVAEALS